jgi:hypothetical protein
MAPETLNEESLKKTESILSPFNNDNGYVATNP